MIAIGLNLILGVLLSCALVLGVRLERRLRGLRESHADFAKAVGELDQAAGRTENSLAALRAGTETAKNEVASRIDQARIACQRLEKLVADADKAATRLASQPLALLDRAPPPARPVQAPPPARRPVAVDSFIAAAPAPLELEEVGRDRPRPAQPAPQPARSVPFKADNDPVIGLPRHDRPQDRARREAFYREMLDGEVSPELDAFDPFEQGRFAHERRAMLAAVMGGRR